MVSHANLVHNLQFSARLGRLRCVERGACRGCRSTTTWDSFKGVLQPVFSGFPCWLMSPAAFLQRPLRWLTAISRYRATHSGGPNFAYDLCSRRVIDEDKVGLDLASWRVAFNGSEPIRQETLDGFSRAFAPCGFRTTAFRPAYGLAEATLLVSSTNDREPPEPLHVRRDALSAGQVSIVTPADQDDRSGTVALVPCGRARGGMDVAIVDPVRHTRCAPGTVGEIWVRGGSVTLGYWRRPAETTAAFAGVLSDGGVEPFLRTGDLGFLADGRLFVTGRIKDVLIVRGVKHYPQDLERTVEEVGRAIRPGCAAVFALAPDGDEIAAAIEVDLPKTGMLNNTDLTAIVDRIRADVVQMHGVQLSAVVVLAAGSLPKTTSGKLQRFACREGLASGNLQTIAMWTNGRIFFDAPLERTA